MRLALTYDLRDDYLALGWSDIDVAEFDRADTIDRLAAALRSLGHDVDLVGNATHLIRRLADRARWDMVFNVAEGIRGTGREALVPALLDHADIPYTFADPLCCALTLDKPAAKRILRDHRLPTPDFTVIESPDDLVNLPFPLFAKPAREGSSKGVSADSLLRTDADLRALCRRLLAEHDQPVLVESYLPGREVTVGILGTGDHAEIIGVLEVGVRDPSGVYGYQTKEECERLVEYRLIDDAFARAAATLALAAYRALGCRDAGRVDLRADPHGLPSIIEVNCLPGLHPEHSDLPIMAAQAGIRYTDLIDRIVRSASRRAAVGGAAPCA